MKAVERHNVVLILLLLFTLTLFSLLSPYFLTLYNLQQILKLSSVLALIAIGEALVILSGGGGIDLSVGSVISLSGIILGLLYTAGVSLYLAVPATILFGALLGSVNGVLAVRLGIPPLMVTLGTMYTFGGLALILGGSGTISGFPESFGFIGQENILHIPAQFLLVVLPLFLIAGFLMKRSYPGRNIYLIGVNDGAAALAGINVKQYRFLLYVISGMLASAGGVLMTSWLMTAKADVGQNMELQAITVVMLGGVSIFGGVGSLTGVFTATLIITMVATGLQLARVNTVWQLAVLGGVLISTVMSGRALEKLKEKRKRLQ